MCILQIKDTTRFIAIASVIYMSISLSMWIFSSKEMSFAKSGNEKNGKKIFEVNCAGCHLNGLNLIKKDKPIIGSNKLKSKDDLKSFLISPPPPMPNFKNIVSKENELEELYNYLLTLKSK